MSLISDNYMQLARAVLMQWAKDGKPDDFGYVDFDRKSTYYDFWETVFWELQREDRLQSTDSVEGKMSKNDRSLV